jgi:hypothetical protein
MALDFNRGRHDLVFEVAFPPFALGQSRMRFRPSRSRSALTSATTSEPMWN